MNDVSFLRAETVFRAFQRSGVRVAVVTAKDKLRTLLGGGLDCGAGNAVCFSAECSADMTFETNGLAAAAGWVGMPQPDVYSSELSEFVLAAGVRLLKEWRPDLMYLTTTDFIQHKHAHGETVANDFHAMVDRYLGELDALERAAELAVLGATKNSGQRCTAVKRILCQEGVADRFVSHVADRARQIRFGDPMDPENDLGTVVHEDAARMIDKRIESAAEAGAEILYHPGRVGALLPPVVLDRVPKDCELVMEETFGPVIPVIRVPDDDDDGPKISNTTAFGLSSGVCTNDFRRMQRYISGPDVGTVNIWEMPGYRIDMSPFGGIKDSGLGYKEGVLEAMKSYTNVKTYSLPWN